MLKVKCVKISLRYKNRIKVVIVVVFAVAVVVVDNSRVLIYLSKFLETLIFSL